MADELMFACAEPSPPQAMVACLPALVRFAARKVLLTVFGVQMQIHWFSIINSCVTVLLLTGFLATILMRVLKNDFVKYTHSSDGRPRAFPHLLQCAGPPRICMPGLAVMPQGAL